MSIQVLEIMKCHGSGNDFVLIDELTGERFSETDRVKLAQLLCDRAGVGADGVLFALPSTRGDARMRMFNPDGSEPQTCGNGLRCLARRVCEATHKDSITIETMKGVSRCSKADEIAPGVVTYTVELGPISLKAADLPLLIASERVIGEKIPALTDDYSFTALAVPNPHLVAHVSSIDQEALRRLGEQIERAPSFLPERANVSFCLVRTSLEIAVATFERGAGITLSCGSAMGASTLAGCLLGKVAWDSDISVVNDGGMVRTRAIQMGADEHELWLSGNATFTFQAEVEVDLRAMTRGRSFTSTTFAEEIGAYANLAKLGAAKMQEARRF